MKLGAKRLFLGATAIAVASLVVVAVGSRVPAEASAQAGAPAAPAGVQLVDDVYKTVVLLKGLPIDTFFESMGMFANSMGNDCTFCHA